MLLFDNTASNPLAGVGMPCSFLVLSLDGFSATQGWIDAFGILATGHDVLLFCVLALPFLTTSCQPL